MPHAWPEFRTPDGGYYMDMYSTCIAMQVLFMFQNAAFTRYDRRTIILEYVRIETLLPSKQNVRSIVKR